MSSRGLRKAGMHRMDGAIAALTTLGFSKKLIRNTINELRKAYGDDDAGWYFVEEDYYKLVIDKIIEDQEKAKKEHVKAEQEEDIDVMESGTTQTCVQPLLECGDTDSRSSSHVSSTVKPSNDRVLQRLDELEMVPTEAGQVNPSSPQIRKPCYGWISEDEE